MEQIWHSHIASAIRYSAMWDRIRRNTTKNSTRWINVQTRQNMNRNCIQFDDLNFTYSDCLDMPGRSSCRKAWPTRHGPAVYRPCQDGIRSGYYKKLDCRYRSGLSHSVEIGRRPVSARRTPTRAHVVKGPLLRSVETPNAEGSSPPFCELVSFNGGIGSALPGACTCKIKVRCRLVS